MAQQAGNPRTAHAERERRRRRVAGAVLPSARRRLMGAMAKRVEGREGGREGCGGAALSAALGPKAAA